jgi:eukaryotic-like serine/threonine-protein kinase
VIDAGEDEHRPYIVFEFVDGETLKERIRRHGRLPIDEALAYAIEIARALHCAHSRAIVHRDIKPQNVLIDEEGSAKVTDFGIARSLDEEGLTADGRVLGTTDYVSPEQALGHDVNGQSDIYSLGVVLFEMLTGDVPFHGENQVAVAMKHVREDLPDVQLLRPECSASTAAVLEHMTEKDLGRRYPDIVTCIADLEDALAIETARAGRATGEATAVLRTLSGSTKRRVPLRVRWHVPVVAVVLILGVAAAAVVLVVGQAAQQTQRGTGRLPGEKPAQGEEPISLKANAIDDYDPLGDNKEEHPDETFRVVDRDVQTAWDTEGYSGGTLQKDGVGLTIDTSPGLTASAIVIRTPKPGWDVEIYGTETKSIPKNIETWQRLERTRITERRTKLPIDARGKRFQAYLVWITSLPEGEERVAIEEIAMFRPTSN